MIMNKKHLLFSLLFTSSILSNAFSQDLSSQSINEQFKTVVDGSNNFQEYKVIKQTQVKALWKNTIDTLNKKQAALNKTSGELNAQKASIQKQQKALLEKEEDLKQTLNSANEISFLGVISLTKDSYKTLMWSLVLILAAVSAFLYLRASSAKKEASYRIKLFEELSDEFKNFKIKSNENEKKLARSLQDERNKLAEYNIR